MSDEFPGGEADGERLRRLTTPRPASEYHEDMGDVLWWRWNEVTENTDAGWAGESPYVGSPNDLGYTVTVSLQSSDAPHSQVIARDVGGWREGYYTHFTPIVMPDTPK